MNSNNQGGMTKVVVVAAITLVVGVFGGFAAGYQKNMNTTSSSVPSSATKAADLRANLVTLGLQHMTLTDQAVAATLDGNKDAGALGSALYQNGDDIGAAVGSVYGSKAQSTFDSVWKLHLDQFVNYAVADSKGDSAGKQAALDAIETGYTKPLAQYLASANPNLPESTLESALNDHVQMTAQMIDDHVQGNYQAEASDLKMADQHIEGIFSTLAEGIVKQYPSKF